MSVYAVYPGSFNPLTYGHLAIANWADGQGYNLLFEVSVNRYGKPPFSEEDISRISNQFLLIGRRVLFSNNISFYQKAYYSDYPQKNRYDELVFLIGADTANRLSDVSYYFNSKSEMDRVLSLIGEKAKFVVFPRPRTINYWTDNSKFVSAVMEYVEDFALQDISSSELRDKK